MVQDKSVESAVFVVSGGDYFKMAEQEPHPSVLFKVQWNQTVYVVILLT